VARVLLERGRGADVNAQSGFDQATALHLCQHVGVARLLVQHGADWRLTNARGHNVRGSAAATITWNENRLGAAPRSRAAMGCSAAVAEWLGDVETHGGYGRWLAGRRLPLVCLHRLVAAGRAELPTAVEDVGLGAEAARLRAALAFVFPGPETHPSLPGELLPRIVRAMVAHP
jgi:hypothetical protein